MRRNLRQAMYLPAQSAIYKFSSNRTYWAHIIRADIIIMRRRGKGTGEIGDIGHHDDVTTRKIVSDITSPRASVSRSCRLAYTGEKWSKLDGGSSMYCVDVGLYS
jgi:hypothetical protein